MAEEYFVILQAACDRDDRNRGQRVRLLASAGIAVQATHKGVVGKPEEDELLSLANQRFTVADTFHTFYPMTWMGKGTLPISGSTGSSKHDSFSTRHSSTRAPCCRPCSAWPVSCRKSGRLQEGSSRIRQGYFEISREIWCGCEGWFRYGLLPS